MRALRVRFAGPAAALTVLAAVPALGVTVAFHATFALSQAEAAGLLTDVDVARDGQLTNADMKRVAEGLRTVLNLTSAQEFRPLHAGR